MLHVGQGFSLAEKFGIAATLKGCPAENRKDDKDE